MLNRWYRKRIEQARLRFRAEPSDPRRRSDLASDPRRLVTSEVAPLAASVSRTLHASTSCGRQWRDRRRRRASIFSIVRRRRPPRGSSHAPRASRPAHPPLAVQPLTAVNGGDGVHGAAPGEPARRVVGQQRYHTRESRSGLASSIAERHQPRGGRPVPRGVARERCEPRRVGRPHLQVGHQRAGVGNSDARIKAYRAGGRARGGHRIAPADGGGQDQLRRDRRVRERHRGGLRSRRAAAVRPAGAERVLRRRGPVAQFAAGRRVV